MGIIPGEVRNRGTIATLLVKTMQAIVHLLSVEEKVKLQPWAEEKLAELEGIGEAVLEDVGPLVHSILYPHCEEVFKG